MRRIYLDYNATTPIAAEVREAMQSFLAEHFGNPSSDHSLGRACSEAISDAREQVAGLIGADPDELIFTSGGTESNNFAMKGIFLGEHSFLEGHLIISSVEHPAITSPAAYLEKHGVEVSIVPCDGKGFVDPDDVLSAIRPDTRLVSVMLANNEVGAIQPLADIAKICHERDVICHTDAAQAVGKIPVDVLALGVDMLSIAGHKLYAPKGVGALYVREAVDLTPLMHGASHERGLRAGTENTPYIVGLGRAARMAATRLAENAFDVTRRDSLWSALQSTLADSISVNGEFGSSLPNTLSASFKDVSGHELLAATPEVCASTGAACHSGKTNVSATLSAMQVKPKTAVGTVRLSTGILTSQDDIDKASTLLADAYDRIR